MKKRLLSAPCHAAFALTIAPLIYFLPAIFGVIVLCPDDALIFNLPIRTAAAAMIRAGELPLWNPYIFGGMPLFASAQGGLLFPLNWFFLLCGPRTAMNLAVLTTYAVAGLGAFLYARRTGASVLGAFVTGFVWQTSGFLIAQIGHTNVIQVASMLPWLLWSIDGYGATGQRSRGVLVALFVALQVFAGHPQTLVYSLMLAGVYTVYWRSQNAIARCAASGCKHSLCWSSGSLWRRCKSGQHSSSCAIASAMKRVTNSSPPSRFRRFFS